MRKSTLYVITAFLLTILMGVLLFNSIKLSNFIDEENDIKKSKVVVSFMHWAYFPEELFSKFTEEYPNISVDYQRYNLSSYSDILQKKIAMGEKLDLVGVNEFDLFKYGNQNVLHDMGNEKFLKNYRVEIREGIQNISNKKEYAVSYNAEYFGMWYNKILFHKYNLEVPKNYKEFLQVCEKFKENDVAPIVLGARDPEAASYLYFLRIIKFMDDENWQTDLRMGKKSFTEGELLNSIEETEKIIQNGFISNDSINLTYQQAFDYFKNAKAAMLISPDRSLNMAKEDFEKVCDPGTFIIPYSDIENKSKTTSNYFSILIAISKDSQNLKESKLLLEFLSRPETAKIYCEDTRSYPTILQTDVSNLKYNDLWEPIRENENRNSYNQYISREEKIILDNNAKAFIAGIVNAEELSEVFQKIFAKGYISGTESKGDFINGEF